MRKLALMAVRTLGETHWGQRIVRAALGGAGLGMAPLWVRHFLIPFLAPVRTRFAQASLQARPGGPSYYVLIRLAKSDSADHRGSTGAVTQVQDSEFRSWPQRGQSPLQSSRQSVRTGRDKSTCSRSTSSSARPPS